ncbi:MAG: hypothetical protein SFZ03_05725 [Candidatus Melainabacteria bacterium]|nr:hypothetical protein [Candidatus Melainabacteria bacterium]
MIAIPKFLLQQLYVKGSLRLEPEGVAFDIKNSLGPGVLTRLSSITLDDTLFTGAQIKLHVDGQWISAKDVTEQTPARLGLNQTAVCVLLGASLSPGKHTLTVDLHSREVGQVVLTVHDQV